MEVVEFEVWGKTFEDFLFIVERERHPSFAGKDVPGQPVCRSGLAFQVEAGE